MDKLYKEITKTIDSHLKEDPSFVATIQFLKTRFRLGENRALDYYGKLKLNGYKVKKKLTETRVGCKYCDGWKGVQHPDEDDGFLVCNMCGAEWAGCKIEYEVSEKELAREQEELEEYEREMEDFYSNSILSEYDY